eukprot:TRINITY_DN7157_c0_g1_i1.p1 TRINITY_DN7157_c0_g1~~TRINITY_DN7157_c0_g1_i1.p1  ORF type:complete len:280 (-),score=36.33 TRINITY_DN7157_c0_g1_i1:162-941(-)
MCIRDRYQRRVHGDNLTFEMERENFSLDLPSRFQGMRVAKIREINLHSPQPLLVRCYVVDKTILLSTLKGRNYFTVILAEENQENISATFWNLAAYDFYDKIQSGEEYFFLNGRVSESKFFKYVKHKFCIQFEKSVRVEKASNKQVGFINPIKDVRELMDLDLIISVSMVFRVISVSEPREVLVKGKPKEIREIWICDRFKDKILLYLWGEKWKDLDLKLNQMYLIRNAILKRYEGKRYLEDSYMTNIVESPYFEIVES